MKFAVILDRDEGGVWVIECPAIPGCVSQGQTREEALTNIEDAIRVCLQVRAEQGMQQFGESSAIATNFEVQDIDLVTVLSEAALSDWNRPEEDEAWIYLADLPAVENT